MFMKSQRGTVRVGLVGFFATLAVLSLSLNGYFLWVIDRAQLVNPFERSRAPAPLDAREHVRGPSDASVTLVVYSDFECAFCRELHASLKQLAATGKFRWVMRHFPIPTHTNAVRYAEACECAGRQGKFWDFADWLFEALTPRLESPAGPIPPGAALPLVRPEPISVDGLVAAAVGMGLDSARFRSCLERQEERSRVEAQKVEGDSLSITATPTSFVNGRRVVGAPMVDELREMVKGNSLQ